ncbi:hypothetical protein HK101_009178 [Irineochytrium annulatum]|nr:hypothetical protein HK101_009178 [Irineochytrium annulatum]
MAKRMIHVGLHILSLAAAIGGLVAIIAYKNLSDQPPAFPFFHLYSPHSWAGIAFLALYILQFIGGAASQAITLSARTHRITRRLHALLGDACYILGVAVCAMGFQDMQGSDLAESSPPMDMMNMTMNMTGYYPDSNLARYASANTLLLIVIAIAVYVAKTKF